MSSLGCPCQPFVCRRLGRSQKSTRKPGEQIGGRPERQQRSAAPLASTAKILSLTSKTGLAVAGWQITSGTLRLLAGFPVR